MYDEEEEEESDEEKKEEIQKFNSCFKLINRKMK